MRKEVTMPENGEINRKFGVYKTVCCGAEIVIREGTAFPECPNHVKLTTVWKSVADESVPHISEMNPPRKTDAA